MKIVSILILFFFLGFSGVLAENPDMEPKLREPYPGEEVTTKDGRKVRRWSTRGPVEVAPAPQPFDDPGQRRTPGGLLLNVDTHQIRQQQRPTYQVLPQHTDSQNGQGKPYHSGKPSHSGKK